MTTALLKRAAATAAFAALALSGAAQANPVVIDFESGFDLVGPTQPNAFYEESGVRFTPTGGDALIGPSFCFIGAESCITNNPSVYLTATNDAEVTITAERWFQLTSFDASFFPSPSLGFAFTGLRFGLKLTGVLWGGGTIEQTVDLVEDAFPGDFLFSSYQGDAGMTVLRSLTFSACYFESVDSCVRSGQAFADALLQLNDMQFAIDNLSLSIPEPSALWLVALSLGGLAFTRRRSAQ